MKVILSGDFTVRLDKQEGTINSAHSRYLLLKPTKLNFTPGHILTMGTQSSRPNGDTAAPLPQMRMVVLKSFLKTTKRCLSAMTTLLTTT